MADEESDEQDQKSEEELLEESVDEMTLREKEILIVKMDDRYTAEEVTQIIQNIGQDINEEQEFTTPVLFLDKSVELEKVSIDRLEQILEHAKTLHEEDKDAQDEVEPEEDEDKVEKNPREDQYVDMDQIPDELEDLIPDNVDKEDL